MLLRLGYKIKANVKGPLGGGVILYPAYTRDQIKVRLKNSIYNCQYCLHFLVGTAGLELATSCV